MPEWNVCYSAKKNKKDAILFKAFSHGLQCHMLPKTKLSHGHCPNGPKRYETHYGSTSAHDFNEKVVVLLLDLQIQ